MHCAVCPLLAWHEDRSQRHFTRTLGLQYRTSGTVDLFSLPGSSSLRPSNVEVYKLQFLQTELGSAALIDTLR